MLQQYGNVLDRGKMLIEVRTFIGVIYVSQSQSFTVSKIQDGGRIQENWVFVL